MAQKSYDAPPAMAIDPDKSYKANIEMEKGGRIVIELYPEEAPNTVNSFVFLAREGYYDGVTFHRVIPGFMAQGGDPTGPGSGGPGYKFDDAFHPSRRPDPTAPLALANAVTRGGPSTTGRPPPASTTPVPASSRSR